ncbi:hypothetical protein J4413_00345 [Candidatus Woesearchaeota archaeon]|nr:hypothetical protein [Candidatus Woesearchaeota archaeon]
MDSRFQFKFTSYFLKQWKGYDKRTKDLVQEKINLIKQNPFRFPKHEGYRFVFKVKLSVGQRYSRLMYAVFMPDTKHITILGVFDRSASYKDFERLFKDLRK